VRQQRPGVIPGPVFWPSNPDDHTTFDADALPQVISELRARGYSFVTLDVLTG
jgi:peptidoglycan/xylan/chitin deacetylase (PgdA/CDA1 family)